jgi:S1-C subfamily serine protease
LRRTHGIPLRLPTGDEVEAEVAGYDGGTDLAVLRLPEDAATSMTPLLIGDDASVRAGHWVAAVARTLDGDLAITAGLIGRVGGAWRTWRGGELDRLIRLDGGLYAGFAGAAVLDANGRAVGLATPALSRSAGVVVPAATVQRVAQELLTRGRIARGYLGIGTQSADIAASIAEAHQLAERSGLLITSVADNSPAAEAGFLLGDVLIEFAGRRIRDIDELQASLGGERIGQRVPAFVLRAGQRKDLTVTLGERPRAHCC